MKNNILFITLLCFSSIAWSSNVGIIVKKQGDSELLTDPSASFKKKKNAVLYEGLYYTSKKVYLGLKVKNGNILRTGAGAKARVVFKNGDQFNISEGTAYKITWSKSKEKKRKASTVNLIYGSLRGVISTKGPRNNLKVKSRNAVMGVRGTDFFFEQKGTSGETSISVIRGKIDVSKSGHPDKVVSIKQGFSTKLTSPSKLNKAQRKESFFQMRRTNKNDLLSIQKQSHIKRDKKKREITLSVKKELDSLEKRALKVTLDDIKEYQPDVYAKIKSKNFKSIASVNSLVVKNALRKAPARKMKKGFDEMDIDFKEDAYKKYFKE